uniref:NADH:ubiquinone reductase (H(+)-translocating) n=1 Tax=Hexamermis agrotis TaxID=387665 RepID=A2TN52_9BILA|nr:NADH dehydrogenase subunit 5 [Hexamermis agrotis]ABM79869.1 NADH dehydrogenase subunit 5 [Hexamermis agrotis]
MCLLPVIQLNLFYSFINFSQWSMLFNSLSIIFLLCLWNIFFNVFQFSKNYMKDFSAYFNSMLVMFMFSMITLIISDSWLMLFMGWEFLGVTSFFLILYYNNWNSLSGALLTMMTNRLGDMFFILSMLFFLSLFKSFMMLIIIMMMSLTKSAQVPFSGWLPAAMAAPTPVSSLVHSSTLVTAGIYVYFRFNIFMNYTFNKLMMLFFLLTMLLGSLSALMEEDLKKLIAFSTLSQLGLIFLSFYSSFVGLMFFHLFVHAFFKSILFIVGGMMIWSMNSSQLLSNCSKLDLSIMTILVLSLINMMSLMFSSGFLSKESLSLLFMFKSIKFVIVIIMIFFLTLAYTWRLMNFMFNNFTKTKSIINFNTFSVELKYMVFMIFFGKMWTNNWFYSLSWSFIFKMMLIIMLIMLILFKYIYSFIFLDLLLINFIFSKMSLLKIEKDSFNSFFYFLESYMMKLQNWKMVMLLTLVLVFF